MTSLECGGARRRTHISPSSCSGRDRIATTAMTTSVTTPPKITLGTTPSVVFHSVVDLFSARRARPTFSMIDSAVAVQMYGIGFSLC